MKKKSIFSGYLSAGKLCGKKCGRNVTFSARNEGFGKNPEEWQKKSGEVSFPSNLRNYGKKMVEHIGLEPMTPTLPGVEVEQRGQTDSVHHPNPFVFFCVTNNV